MLSIIYTHRGLLNKILIGGVLTPSVGKDSGKSPVNGCGTCASHWDRRCREARYARSSGPPPKKLLPLSWLRKIRLRSMAYSSGLQRSDEPLGDLEQRPSSGPREREAALPGRGQPELRAKCVKRMRLRERAVYLAYQTDCLPCALREQCLVPGATGNRARRISAVRRLLPPPSSVECKPVMLGPMRLSWMWQVERFAAPG